MTYSVIIADDHDIIREGIKSILISSHEYSVVGEAADGEEVLTLVEGLKPDILLLDITMPKKSGLDVIRQVQYVSPETKIVVVTMHRANIYLKKAFSLGVKACLHKENVVDDLLPALRRVQKGETYVSVGVSQALIGKVLEADDKIPSDLISLSDREGDILRLVVEGKTAKQIADILAISPRTVENYKNNLLRKLDLHKTSDLIKYAIQHGIVEID
ncbi:MAG: response regulator transcription factor [Candidatus Omnitrophica bacterium]|nr:response regulator transcription factor [Candidatus Omnitrophota bacterium]